MINKTFNEFEALTNTGLEVDYKGENILSFSPL